ncbi:MAG: GAF domain-containing sensor histidine kinase [Candidatus Binatia bacterium]
MEAAQTIASPVTFPGSGGIFEAARKITVIRVRWLVVIVCSYLLLSSQNVWPGLTAVHGLVLFYLLTNVSLYFVSDRLFESSYFYSPLVVFDTLFVTGSLVVSGQVETDFYLAYFLIVILCSLWQDFRGLVVVGLLATLLYGYFLFQTTQIREQSVYLRLPFLFVISLFYGYFAQVVRAEKRLKEQAAQDAEDMAMIQSLSQSLPSSLDGQQILETVAEKINNVIHAANVYIFIVDETQGPVLLWGGEGKVSVSQGLDLDQYPVVQDCLLQRSPVMQHYGGAQASGESGGDRSFPTAMAVPIVFRSEVHGVILLGFADKDRMIGTREIQFCQVVAFATAIALSNAKKYEALQAEAKQRQIIAEQLAEANRLKSEYLTNTSHELRTPIATIMGYAHLLTDGICGPLADEQRNTLARLMENARGLLRLVDQVLDYSKLEKGQTGLFAQRQDLGPLLDQIRRELAPLEAGRPYKVQFDIQRDIPPIETDWGKLKNVLMNILDNAIKFTDRGEVRLSVAMRSRDEISFLVSDTGVGIPKNQIPLIFEKFRQLDGSMARRHEGAGLGLTISKNLVDLIGGKIEVESETGKGSTFTVIVPVSES